jgi:putative transposase
MPRPLRKAAGGVVYHVINRANGRLRIFKKPADFLAFERVISQAIEQVNMRICGYCIMGTHWHFLLWPREDGDLSEFMKWLTVTHTSRWHKAHGPDSTGHVYQGRFKSFPVQSTEHYLKVLRYIEQNPVRAKLVKRPDQWQWSSCAGRTSRSDEIDFLRNGPVRLPANWNRSINRATLNETEIDSIELCIKRGRPYGSELWTTRIANKLELAPTLRPIGRPKTKT